MKFKVAAGYKKANKPISIRFTEDLYKELKEFAAEKEISLNSLVLHCCRYSMDNAATDDDDD